MHLRLLCVVLKKHPLTEHSLVQNRAESCLLWSDPTGKFCTGTSLEAELS